jgi:hypothetical protein
MHALWRIHNMDGTLPFLAVLAQLVRKGVEVRLIHAKEPGPAFREDFDKYPSLAKGLEKLLSIRPKMAEQQLMCA